jgi:hypothetical protein
MEDPTAARPACTVRVGDMPHSLDLTPILVRQSPHQAQHTLRGFCDRPAGVLEAATPALLARIAAATDWEIENPGPPIAAFLERIGGEPAFEQWLALARWRDEAERALRTAEREADELRGSRLETGDDDDLACDVTGRYGSLLAHRHEYAWRVSRKAEECADPTAPYVWAAEAAAWAPIGSAQMDCAIRGGAAGITEALRRLAAPSVEPERHGIDWAALQRELHRMIQDGATTSVVLARVQAWQASQTNAMFRRAPDLAYAVDPQHDLRALVDWCERRIQTLHAEIAGIGACWRSPAGPFVAVRDRLARKKITLERDPVSHRVTWVEITDADPDGLFEHGPFHSLELALDDLRAKTELTPD